MNKVLIIISGGAVQGITKPKGIELKIRDYDVDRCDLPENNPQCRQDKDGDWYQLMFWSKNQVEG